MRTDPELLAALGRGRRAVEEHMTLRLSQGFDRWNEQTVTDLLCTAAFPALRYIPFNPRQEGVVGADWLWWWIDRVGECFGLLLQAKNVYHRQTGWFIDLQYRRGQQMRDLLVAADVLQIPAGYLLYCGDRAYRIGLDCDRAHADVPCAERERAAVTLVTALVAQHVVSYEPWPSTAAVAAFHHSIPIEDLADPSITQTPIMDLNLCTVGPRLRGFLQEPQVGARQIARLIFADLSRIRSLQFAVAVADQVDIDTSVFPHLPSDTGHFSAPYFPHLLRGLRPTLPSYVQAILAGGSPPEWMPTNVVGMVTVTV